MAVQKSKVSRSRRDQRRAHDCINRKNVITRSYHR